MIRRLLPLAVICTLALPAFAARDGKISGRRAARKRPIKSKHVIDFTSSPRVVHRLGLKFYTGPQNAVEHQTRLTRGTKLLLVVPAVGKDMVLPHDAWRPADFGKRSWYERLHKDAVKASPYEILNGNIALGGGKQGVLVRVKNNIPPPSARPTGSRMDLYLVKPDGRSSQTKGTIYALKGRLVGGRTTP